MGRSTITMQVQNYKEFLGQISSIQKKGKVAMQRTVSDMKRRLPGPIATTVRKYYSIEAAEINPTSTKAVQGKEAASIKVEGDTVASLSLVYEGRVLTPFGHGFGLTETPGKNGHSKIRFSVKKKRQQIKGKYGTAYMAPAKAGSTVRIPFQRVPGTDDIEVIRTVAVPEMIDNKEANAAIYERIGSIVNDRAKHNFKRILE